MKRFILNQTFMSAYLCAGAAASATVSWASPSYAFSLGRPTDYNVFVLSDYTMQSTDVWGKLAVGGSLTADTFGVGTQLRGDKHERP